MGFNALEFKNLRKMTVVLLMKMSSILLKYPTFEDFFNIFMGNTNKQREFFYIVASPLKKLINMKLNKLSSLASNCTFGVKIG